MRDFNESQPYVQHLLAEHRRLHQMLQAARHAILRDEIKNDAKSGEAIALTLRRVRDELASHFAEEEQDGCMDEAISYCPNLAAEVRQIKSDHPRLLTALDELIALMADGRLPNADRSTLEKHFAKVCENLHAHEAAENDMLRRGFGTNVNGEDNGSHLESFKA